MFYSVTCFQGDTERDVFSQQTIPHLNVSKSIVTETDSNLDSSHTTFKSV